MKTEIIPHIEAIASIMKMTKVNDEFYYGEHGTLFKATNFGFVVAKLADYDNPKHPHFKSLEIEEGKCSC